MIEIASIHEFDRELQIPNIWQLELDVSIGARGYIIVLQIQEMSNIYFTHGRVVGVALLRMICDFIKLMNIEALSLYRIESDSLAVLIRETSSAKPLGISEAIHARFNSGWSIVSIHGQITIATGVNVCAIAIDNERTVCRKHYACNRCRQECR